MESLKNKKFHQQKMKDKFCTDLTMARKTKKKLKIVNDNHKLFVNKFVISPSLSLSLTIFSLFSFRFSLCLCSVVIELNKGQMEKFINKINNQHFQLKYFTKFVRTRTKSTLTHYYAGMPTSFCKLLFVFVY